VGHPGYAKEFDQPPYNTTAAMTALEQAGWVKGKNGIRVKNSVPLNIIVVAEETPDNQLILSKIKEQWKAIGVDMQAALQQTTDFQSSVETHAYSALLYTISIGPDPDVYAYWSSTQADPRSSNRLNFSEYKSTVADTALEGGRTRQDPTVRALKYKPFLKAWQEDAPAIALYQPKILYISRGFVQGLDEHSINTDADRYYSVTNWAVKIGQIAK
jgi:peptide/nickel transport system substrate-binding protein